MTHTLGKVAHFIKKHKKAYDLSEIADALELSPSEVKDALDELVRTGAAVITPKGKYADPEGVGLIAARMQVVRSGAPIAQPLDGSPGLLIRRRGALRPMADDLILVRAEPYDGKGMLKCELVDITHRAHDRFDALLTLSTEIVSVKTPKSKKRKGKRGMFEAPLQTVVVPEFQPIDPRITAKMQLQGGLKGARSGDLVFLRIVDWPERNVPMLVEIEGVKTDVDFVDTQLRTLVKERRLNEEFPPDALQQASEIPTRLSEEDFEGRMDLRDLTLFTIDGDDAQDFDDAISLEPVEGKWRLGVHIADVSHYVPPKTPIDTEALARGTSVYLPGLTLPMLPEALSNHMCSLMPGVDRLAMSLIMTIDQGEVVDHVLSPSVIHSRARLTYHEVNKMLGGRSSNVPEELHGTLRSMLEVSKCLRERRHARGSIDFDLPESAFTLDKHGYPTDVHARERGEAERLIEDFMLLANETVARLARTAKLPFIYRVHGRPSSEKLKAFRDFMTGLNLPCGFGDDPQPRDLQKIVEQTEGLREADVIKQVMLRSLMRAEYSDEPQGHFGLAARDYCHFTSPIRRYPDLEAHRMLKLMLSGKKSAYAKQQKRMAQLAADCSLAEMKATQAERDADDLLKAYYMARHVGEEYDGIVTGVVDWGFYVTLPSTVEGLVHVRTLEGEYHLDRARQALCAAYEDRMIRLGDAVRIRVDRVSTRAVEIDFVLVEQLER